MHLYRLSCSRSSTVVLEMLQKSEQFLNPSESVNASKINLSFQGIARIFLNLRSVEQLIR